MNEYQLKAYEEAFQEEKGALPMVSIIQAGTKFHNAPNTKDRKAWNGASWINYWQAMTKQYRNFLTCAACGKHIIADVKPYELLYKWIGEECHIKEEVLNKFQAEGGHIFKNGVDAHDGYQILPLCSDCNNPNNNDEMICKEDTVVCDEVGASSH